MIINVVRAVLVDVVGYWLSLSQQYYGPNRIL